MDVHVKDRRYANRGMPLEEFIRYANEKYRVKGVAVIEKLPTEFIPIRGKDGKICTVKVEHKSKVDFLGRYYRYPIAIEAKSTTTDAIRFDEIQPHQEEYMKDFTHPEDTIGLVVISYGLNRFFAVPWKFWEIAYEYRVRRRDRTTRLNLSFYGQTWEVPRKFSVRADELNPLWEVSGRDLTYGLRYLEKAGRYKSLLQP